MRARRRVWPLVMMAFGLVLIAGAAFWYSNSLRPQGTRSIVAVTEDTYPQAGRISLEEAKQAFDEGKAVFLDVRDAAAYASSHIQGAENISLSELPSRMAELDKNDWIVTYCT